MRCLHCMHHLVGSYQVVSPRRMYTVHERHAHIAPMTREAPPRAANSDRIPLPHPTSSTVASLSSPGLLSSAALYASVRGCAVAVSHRHTYFNDQPVNQPVNNQHRHDHVACMP